MCSEFSLIKIPFMLFQTLISKLFNISKVDEGGGRWPQNIQWVLFSVQSMLKCFQSGQRGKQSPTVYQGAMGLDRVVVMVVVVVVVVVVGAIVVTSVRNTMTSALCEGGAQGMAGPLCKVGRARFTESARQIL